MRRLKAVAARMFPCMATAMYRDSLTALLFIHCLSTQEVSVSWGRWEILAAHCLCGDALSCSKTSSYFCFLLKRFFSLSVQQHLRIGLSELVWDPVGQLCFFSWEFFFFFFSSHIPASSYHSRADLYFSNRPDSLNMYSYSDWAFCNEKLCCLWPGITSICYIIAWLDINSSSGFLQVHLQNNRQC